MHGLVGSPGGAARANESGTTASKTSYRLKRSRRDAPVRWSKARQGVVWPRQTNVWRKATSPARGFRRLTSDGSAAQFLWRCQLAKTPLRGLSAAGLSPPFGGAGRAEAEHELPLFHCLRVWGYCIGRWCLFDPFLLIILWLWRKTHIRRNWVPIFFFLGLIFLIQGISALIGPNELMALAYILAGAAK